VIEPPDTHYAKTRDGVHLAYQVVGNAPLDLVFIPHGGSHVELAWEVPVFARAFQRLASFSRLIRFDHAGTGMSDPLGRNEQPSLESRAEELLTVLDEVGSARATLLANNVGGLLAIFFAASYPNRTASLVLDGCYARLARAPDYPWGIPKDVLEWANAQVADRTSGDALSYTGMRFMAPHAMRDPELLAQYRRYYRSTTAVSTVEAHSELAAFGDVRALLPTVQAPTLVLYRSGDQLSGKPYATYLAEHIPSAKLVEVPGEDNFMFVGNSDADLDEIEDFLTGHRHPPATDRILATVLFTDIVGSTDRAGQLGDRRWRELLDSHDRVVRRQLERFRGQEVNTAGDGFIARFDGPGRAIECACAIRDAVRVLDLEVRAGLHTGEIELRGDDVAGMAVHIGARVAALAEPGEVLVSSTVKDLVAGSGIEFCDRGEHELRGVPGAWHLFRVEA
jgi:class 3 adenylate cyclase/alpha-beta hydrolase superfamily lysophospholipase